MQLALTISPHKSTFQDAKYGQNLDQNPLSIVKEEEDEEEKVKK